MNTYSISQIAKMFNIEPHTLRFYEKEGLITPERTESGLRKYNDEDITRLEMAMCLKSTGMPLKEIKHYFDLCDQGSETEQQRLEIFLAHRERVKQEIEILNTYLEKIDRKISMYKERLKMQAVRSR